METTQTSLRAEPAPAEPGTLRHAVPFHRSISVVPGALARVRA